MSNITVIRKPLSQVPVRNFAAIWILNDKLKLALPVIAQAIVELTYDSDEPDDKPENELDFVVYSGSEVGAELVSCRYSFPFERYGSAWIVPCSSEQWESLFLDAETILPVATDLCARAKIAITGWITETDSEEQ